MIKCFEANYPESLGSVLVHKAPWVFQGTYSLHIFLPTDANYSLTQFRDLESYSRLARPCGR